MTRVRRFRVRGAVLVESLIVTSFLIVALIAGLFFHRLYAAKLRAIREARVEVWLAANSAGCGGGTIDLGEIVRTALSDLLHGDVAPSSWVDEATTPGMAGGTSEPPAFFGAVGHRSQSSSFSVASHPALGGGARTLRATDRLACNELPASSRGDMLSVFGFAARNMFGAVW
ncbi:MAG: hypothetical protein QM756_36755 [Polyangiaceae bacterium]